MGHTTAGTRATVARMASRACGARGWTRPIGRLAPVAQQERESQQYSFRVIENAENAENAKSYIITITARNAREAARKLAQARENGLAQKAGVL
jgi:hypothetical protein